ncbi:MAG: type II toxin-antitoxin system HicA family toxin [Syntrophobacteraceae bacterium]
MIDKFPADVPIEDVIKALAHLGFQVVRRGNHIALIRKNDDGTQTPMTIPNHRKIKGSTLRTILTQSGITRDEFLTVFERI